MPERISGRETLMASDIEAGMPIGDVMGAGYEGMQKNSENGLG